MKFLFIRWKSVFPMDIDWLICFWIFLCCWPRDGFVSPIDAGHWIKSKKNLADLFTKVLNAGPRNALIQGILDRWRGKTTKEDWFSLTFLAGAMGRRKTVLCLRNYFVRRLFSDRAILHDRCDRWFWWWRWWFRWILNFEFGIYLFYFIFWLLLQLSSRVSFQSNASYNSRSCWRAHHRRRKTVLFSVGIAFGWIIFLRRGRFYVIVGVFQFNS